MSCAIAARLTATLLAGFEARMLVLLIAIHGMRTGKRSYRILDNDYSWPG